MPRAARFPVVRPGQIEALASPVRQEIADTLQAQGAASAAELGRLLGRAPDSLYYHLRRLQRVGLVRARIRREDGREEALFELPGRLVIPAARLGARARALLGKAVSAMLRLTGRDLRGGLAAGRIVTAGPGRNAHAGRVKGWVGRRDARRLLRILEKIEDQIAGGSVPGRGRLYAVTLVMLPLDPGDPRSPEKKA